MKIALLSLNYNCVAGYERRTYNLAENFASQGMEVHIFAHKIAKLKSHPAIIFHKVGSINFFSFLKVLSFAWAVKQELKKYSFDIIHSQVRTLHQDVVTLSGGCHQDYLNKLFGVNHSRVEKFFRLLNPIHFTIISIENIQYRKKNCNKIITNSRLSKDGLLKYYDFQEKDVRIIYNGVDLEEFDLKNREKYRADIRKKIGVKSDELLIIFVGNGFKRKGLEYLIKGVGGIKKELQKKIKIFVAGKGSKKHYQKMSSRLGIEDNVFFAGVQKEMKKIYAAGDFFVLPTIFDPFSNALLEAMASGLPVITTVTNGASEIIEEGNEGFVLKQPDDIAGISEKIEMLFDDDLRIEMGKKARKKAEHYTLKKNIDETMIVYKEILNSK